MYKVEKILDKKMKGDTVEYKIKWKGYSMKDCTWEPVENLRNIEDMVIAFDKNFQKNINKKNPHVGRKRKNSEEETTEDDEKNRNEATIITIEEEPVKRKRGRPRKNPRETTSSHQSELQSAVGCEVEETSIENLSLDKNTTSGDKIISQSLNHANLVEHLTPLLQISQNNFYLRQKNVIVAYEVPDRVLSAKMDGNDEIFFLVQWKKRSDGTQPEDSFVTNDSMRSYFPHLLLDYYQSKVTHKKGGNI